MGTLSIKSLFVPDYALQGQTIPIHVIWESVECKALRLEFSPELSLESVYNAEEFKSLANGVLVEGIRSNGYLGFLLGSHILPDSELKCKVVFSFLDSSGNVVLKNERSTCFFRPNLVIMDPPDKIVVEPAKKFVKPRIGIRNAGKGIVLIDILTLGNSEVKRDTEHYFKEYIRNFRRDLEIDFAELGKSNPQYAELFNDYSWFMKNYGDEWSNAENFQRFREFVIEMVLTMSRDKEFWEKFSRTLAGAVVKNIHLLTRAESFIMYLNSIRAKNIVLIHPEEVVSVSKEPKTLLLGIISTDVMLNLYPLIEIHPVKIVGSEEGVIEIMRLFEWRGE